MAKKFYAQKDALGFPIPGTMMSVSGSTNVPKDSILIPAQNVTAGGETSSSESTFWLTLFCT